jgi:dipeptidyl aminopeptidase/acylaminoacyl peptidase
MNGPLYGNLNSYIKNSPIFGAKNIKTPLLLLDNLNDGNVPWEQGLEFFTVLRRLKKRFGCWSIKTQRIQ